MRVCVLGGGPGGLFVCHNLEKKRQQWIAEGKDLEEFPEVVCFEKALSPGGVWRASKPVAGNDDDGTAANEFSTSDSTPCMYDNLWTNGTSHVWEFGDHTFDEHFGRPVTVYLPRKDVLGYILARVTKNCPDFMDKYLRFGQHVLHVSFDEATEKFCIDIKDVQTGNVSQEYFDRCVWACGENGNKRVPPSLKAAFKNYEGQVKHSSETDTLEDDLKGKRVVLIGGEYSAEDLALQAVKLGAARVYVVTRGGGGAVTWTKSWPKNKVEVLKHQAVWKVEGTTIYVKNSEFVWPASSKLDESSEARMLDNIDTVMLCTGYTAKMKMMSDELKTYLSSDYVFNESNRLEVPQDWKMAANCVDPIVKGCDVQPGTCYYYPEVVVPTTWKGFLIKNPHMFYLDSYQCNAPLAGLDVCACLYSAFLLGELHLPSKEEMKKHNKDFALRLLDKPIFRYHMDSNYAAALHEYAPEQFWEPEPEPSPIEEVLTFDWLQEDLSYLQYGYLGEDMRRCNYPLQLGKIDELNANGNRYAAMADASYYNRANAIRDKENGIVLTFRDYEDTKPFRSFFTGTEAVRLKKPWLEME